LVLALCAPTAVGTRAQEVGDVAQRELEYRAAKGAHDAALGDYNAQYNAYERIIDQVTVARNAGDDAALDAALGRWYQRSLEIGRLDLRVQEQRERLERARGALLAALDAELESVGAQLAAGPGVSAASALVARSRDLRLQYEELEEEGSAVLTPREIVLTQLRYDPRNTPAEVRLKVDYAERRIEEAREALREVDRQIQRVSTLLRVERSGRDFRGGLNRFGDDQVPVGQPAQGRDGQPAVADTTGLTLEELPLDQQLSTLRAHRAQLEVYIGVFEERVKALRAHLPRTQEMP
jgi:hypothetical protein